MAAALSARRFRRHAVQLAAIAGREHQRLREHASARNCSAARLRLVRRERNAFAQLHGRGQWFNPMSTISIGR